MAIDRKVFFRRLKIYLIGCGLGCIVVWATLFNKDHDRPSWLPEGRILEFLVEADITINNQLKCELECHKIPVDFLKTDTVFWKNAEVDFDKSAVHRKPCPEHYIKSKLADGRPIGVYVENCETCIDCPEEFTASLRGIVDLADKEKVCLECQ